MNFSICEVIIIPDIFPDFLLTKDPGEWRKNNYCRYFKTTPCYNLYFLVASQKMSERKQYSEILACLMLEQLDPKWSQVTPILQQRKIHNFEAWKGKSITW